MISKLQSKCNDVLVKRNGFVQGTCGVFQMYCLNTAGGSTHNREGAYRSHFTFCAHGNVNRDGLRMGLITKRCARIEVD